MRGAVLASTLVALALSGCMHWSSSSSEDWDAYDSGRGLAFGTILTILLITGAAILISNLSSSRRQAPAPQKAPEPAAPAGWQPVEPEESESRKPAARRPSKSAKPRRPSP